MAFLRLRCADCAHEVRELNFRNRRAFVLSGGDISNARCLSRFVEFGRFRRATRLVPAKLIQGRQPLGLVKFPIAQTNHIAAGRNQRMNRLDEFNVQPFFKMPFLALVDNPHRAARRVSYKSRSPSGTHTPGQPPSHQSLAPAFDGTESRERVRQRAENKLRPESIRSSATA